MVGFDPCEAPAREDHRHGEIEQAIERGHLCKVGDLSRATDISGGGEPLILEERAQQSGGAEATGVLLKPCKDLFACKACGVSCEGEAFAVLEDAITRSFRAFWMEEGYRGVFAQGDLHIKVRGCKGFFTFFELDLDSGGLGQGVLVDGCGEGREGRITGVEDQQSFVGKQVMQEVGKGRTDGAMRCVVLLEQVKDFLGEGKAAKRGAELLECDGKGLWIERIMCDRCAPCESIGVFDGAEGQDLPVVLGETACGDLGEIVIFDLEPKQRDDRFSAFGFELPREADGRGRFVEGVEWAKKKAHLLTCDNGGGSFLGEGVEVGFLGWGAFFGGMLCMKDRKEGGGASLCCALLKREKTGFCVRMVWVKKRRSVGLCSEVGGSKRARHGKVLR